MKVLWIADFGLHHNIGGAQRSDKIIIDYGINLGHQICTFHHDSPIELLHDSYDVVVSSNLEILHRSQNVVSLITNHKRHVRLEHDSNAYLTQTLRSEIFGSAKISLFLTEFHHQQFLNMYGGIFNDVEIIEDPIDTNLFRDFGQDREHKTLYLGFMHYFKGTQNFFNHVIKNPSKKFVMAAWGSQDLEYAARSFHNVEWLGKVAFDRMPDLLNNYTTLYYHPTKFEPFCRSVAEAAFCGMKLDCSDNIGSIHSINKYGLETFKKQCQSATKRFWETIS